MQNTPTQNLTYEIKIACPPELAHYLEELLWTLPGVEAVMESYGPGSHDQTRLEDLNSIKLFTPDAANEERVRILLATEEMLKAAGCAVIEVVTITEEDWFESWKAHWHLAPVTDNLVICPTWEKSLYAPLKPEERVMFLDPGAAFGTGTHETTRLMLAGLEKLAKEKNFSQLSVLDVGTGSGILAIYAAMLGSRSVMGVDNDPAAIPHVRENADLNNVQITATDTPLGELCMTRYDLVLANIIAPIILELLPEMTARLEKGGTLLTSGLIETSVGTVEEALREAGFGEFERTRMGDWFSLRGVYQP